MTRKRRTRRRTTSPPLWRRALGSPWCGRMMRTGGVTLAVLLPLVAAGLAVRRLEGHVRARVLVDHPEAQAVFVDLPPSLDDLAFNVMHDTVAGHLRRPWTDDRLCRDIAAALAGVAWVEKVHYVRRRPDARILISCRYRIPVAMVQSEARFLLVDASAVRLPGQYSYDPTWHLIQGAEAMAPPPGHPWPGKDLRAGLDVLAAIRGESFVDQISAVLVDNFAGRTDPLASHISLATDRSGGRIRWGSAPGYEVEENRVEQKVALLRENYRQTGRVDGNHLVIDIAVHPDRYVIPG